MKIGSVPYYNALPLVAKLPKTVELISLPPKKLTQALLNQEIDVGLIPAFAVLKHDFYAYPEAGLIGCHGPVQSVGFFTKNKIPLSEIETLYLDNESETSVHLGKIILNKLYNRNLRSLQEVNLKNCTDADAQLLIGDKALFFQESDYQYWDLGQLWHDLTGMGFLFATWASRRPLKPHEIDLLKEAKLTGLKNKKELIPNDLPQAKQEILKNYLTQAITYEFTQNIQTGFELYQDCLKNLKFIKSSAA